MIRVSNVSKHFGDFAALDDVSLEVPEGSLGALLGPSGSGKSTLLRIIAGLERPDTGQVLIDGQDTTGVPPQERNIGFVFQHYAAFKHMTVRENVAFGLKIRKQPKPQIDARVDELLGVVGLSGYQQRYPSQLSGGQRQRMALARALAVEPKVLLLDEPFGALDAKVRKELRRWLRQLHDEIHVTSVFVTHDQEEALEISDRVVVINKGKVEQVGTPEEVYDHPATPFVASFLGSVNLFHGRVENGHLHVGDDALALASTDGSDGNAVAFVRPHEFDLVPGWEARGGLPARIVRIVSVGPSAQIELTHHDGELIEVTIGREAFRLLGLSEGDQVSLRPRHIRVFPSEAQAA